MFNMQLPAKLGRVKKRLNANIVNTPAILQVSYLPSLDGFRGIFLLIIVLFHVLMSYKVRVDLETPGLMLVQFFFTISGFLITTLLIKEKVRTGHISLRKFYIRRVFRILPASYLYLVVVLIANYVLKLHLHLYFILAAFLFVRNFFVTENGWKVTGSDHLTSHYWSLSFEEQFYIFFPIILKKNMRVYILFLLAIIVFSIFCDFYNGAIFRLLGANTFAKDLIWFVTGLKCTCVGSLFSILVFKNFLKIQFKHKTVTTIILAALVLSLNFASRVLPNSILLVQSSIFGCIMIDNLNNSGNAIFKCLNAPLIKLIGVLSYSLYIWQQPLTLQIPFVNNLHFIKTSAHPLFIDVCISVVSLVILGVVGYCSYFFYEKRFLAIGQRFR